MVISYPPNFIKEDKKSIFLAGTIDMGNSHDWQSDIIDHFKDSDILIYNPRRSDWNNSWKQELGDSNFVNQVEWELNCLDESDVIIMNFLEGSKSPISMLELGLYANTGKLLVCCPKEFYRSGNILIVCRKYNIPVFDDMQELLSNVNI
jgi:hypothetical protein